MTMQLDGRQAAEFPDSIHSRIANPPTCRREGLIFTRIRILLEAL